VNRLQSYIRPLVWSSFAPGHHGIRAPGASRLQGLEGHARYRLYPRWRTDRSAMDAVLAVRCAGVKFLL
jgi:hypothetical protein